MSLVARGAAGPPHLPATGGTIGSPTTTATRCGRGRILPLGRICSLPPIADRHDRHAELHREVRGAVEQVRDLGPAARVPFGEDRHRLPALERRLEGAQRGAVGGAALDRHRAQRGEEPSPERVLNISFLAMKRIVRVVTNAANGMSRIDRCDGARMYAPVARHVLLADDAHPEHAPCTGRARRARANR